MAGNQGDHQPLENETTTSGRRLSSSFGAVAHAEDHGETNKVLSSSTPKMTLHHAASQNQERQLAYFLTLKGNDVNKRDDLERTPLIVAAKKGHERIVQILLERQDIDINAKAKGGITALHVASFEGHAHIVEQLVQHAKNSKVPSMDLLNARTTQESFTPLHMAACKSEAVVRLIWEAYELARLTQEELIDAVNARDCIGWTPLHYATWQGKLSVVGELLSLKFLNVNASDQDGFTALHLASWKGYTDLVRLLLNHGDEEDVSDVEPNKEAGSNLRTLDRISTLQKDVDWDQLPRPKLAQYNIKEHRKKVTPLHYAVEQNNEEIVKELLKNPSTDVHMENSEQKSTFDMAMSSKNSKLLWDLLGNYREKFEVWEKLRNQLSKRGYKNFIGRGHETHEKKLNNCGELLKAAMEKLRYDDVIFLLQELETQLIDLNVRIKTHEKTNVTLLHHAAFAGLEKLVDILTDIPGMEINAEDGDQQTPLHYAAVAGKAAVVRVLINKPSCRANAEDKFDRTALQVAVESKKKDVEKLLLDRPEVRDYVDRFYRNRQVFVDAANTMLLGAALIASVTFGGWLQPAAGFTPYTQFEVPGAPPGTYETFAAVEQHSSVRMFWIFNSLSFFSAIATVIAGAGAVLPTLEIFIGVEVKFVKRTLVATSTLLVFSLVFILGAFAAGGYASLPPLSKYVKSMTATVAFGVFLCLLSMLWFLKRLYGIRPTWWRSLEDRFRPRQRINEKVRSARDLFRKPRQD
ncbi:unnamed protein product [Calypogeia fissa]